MGVDGRVGPHGGSPSSGEIFVENIFCSATILFRNVTNRNRTAFFVLSVPSASPGPGLPDALFRTKKAALEVSQLEIGLRSPAHADVSTPDLSSGQILNESV